MIGKLMEFFRRTNHNDRQGHDDLDVKIEDERRLARLAKSEALELLFQSTVDDLRKTK